VDGDADRFTVEVVLRGEPLAQGVGRTKRADKTPIYAPHRERQVLQRAMANNRGPLADRTIEAIFRELMSGSFSLTSGYWMVTERVNRCLHVTFIPISTVTTPSQMLRKYLPMHCPFSSDSAGVYRANMIQRPTPNITTKENGIITFHAMYINWSTRRRGSVQRSHICTKIKTIPLPRNQNAPHQGPERTSPNGLFQPPKNRVVEDMPAWRTEDGRRSLRHELVESLIESGATQEALLMITQMREEGESDPVLDLYQGQALAREGFGAESERMLLQYRESAPRDARPLKTLGVIYAESNRTPEAIAVLQKAVALDEGDATAWNNLGFLLLSEKQYPEAQEALQKAVELDGTQPRFRNNLGFALAANGHFREAFEAFQSVGSADVAHYNVAVAYELAGDRFNINSPRQLTSRLWRRGRLAAASTAAPTGTSISTRCSTAIIKTGSRAVLM